MLDTTHHFNHFLIHSFWIRYNLIFLIIFPRNVQTRQEVQSPFITERHVILVYQLSDTVTKIPQAVNIKTFLFLLAQRFRMTVEDHVGPLRSGRWCGGWGTHGSPTWPITAENHEGPTIPFIGIPRMSNAPLNSASSSFQELQVMTLSGGGIQSFLWATLTGWSIAGKPRAEIMKRTQR